MLVVLDIQHAGKPDHPKDRGCVSPVWPGLEEVSLTRRYADAADSALRAAGVDCIILSDGSYPDRWKRADSYEASCYIACHINAGINRTGDRGEVYHWPGSKRGTPLAQHLAAALKEHTPWPCSAMPAQTDRVKGCIAGVIAPAIVFEPGFMDGKEGAIWLPHNTEAIGKALAAGVIRWAKEAKIG